MELKDIKVGSPYLFNSTVYGRTAVHVTSIYQGLIHFSIDGGSASRQVRDFPELSDGTHYAIPERIEKRETRARKTKAETAGSFGMVPGLPAVKNTIREVPGIGKVAVVTMDPTPKNTGIAFSSTPLVTPAEALDLPKERRPKRLSLAQALVQARKMADAGMADWHGGSLADKLKAMTYRGLQQYARENYSTIGKLTKTADIIAAILAIESKNNEVTF